MTEEEMQGRVRQLEQVAKRRDAGAVVVLGVWCEGWRVAIHWSTRPTESYFWRTADGAFRLAETALGSDFAERVAIDDWIKREERAAGETMRAVYLPGVTGCPRVME